MTASPFSLRLWMTLLVVLMAITARVTDLLPNFSPLTAICLWCATLFASRWMAVGFSLFAIWMSDLAINHFKYASEGYALFYPGSHWQYASYAVIVLFGAFALKKLSVTRMLGSSLGASVLFFGLSNFGTWASTGLYEKSWAGLLQCYVAAIPFFRGTLTGDLFYTTVFFGAFLLARRQQQTAAARGLTQCRI